MTELAASSHAPPRARRLLVGFCLLGGAVVGQFAGGRVPDALTLPALLLFLLGLSGATLAFAGRAKRSVLTLTGLCLALAVLMVVVGPGRWSLGGVWLFDLLAPFFLVVALIGASATDGGATVNDATLAPAGTTRCDGCGQKFPSHHWLRSGADGGYLCPECRGQG